jgi:transcriptional regulator with XRE-family HTH domain
MNIRSSIESNTETSRHRAGAVLSEARQRRGYSLDDLAETSGLTVDEVAALESGEDTDQMRMLRAAAAVGITEKDLKLN